MAGKKMSDFHQTRQILTMKKQKAPNPNNKKNTGILCHRERGRQSNASDLGKNENVVSILMKANKIP